MSALSNQVDTLCVDCGVADPVWFASNELFNRVMGSGVGIICPVCFIKRAEAKGIVPTAWSLQEELPLRIERVWSMPNKWTFTVKPIADLIAEEVGTGMLVNGLWCDPFAGEASPAQVTNDIHPERKATHHMDALAFLKSQPSNHFDGVLYDPPYSFRQAKECYDEANIEPPKGYTSMGYWSDVRNELARILKPGGKALCFGWNSMGLGRKRGLTMTRVLLVPHGGNRKLWGDEHEITAVEWSPEILAVYRELYPNDTVIAHDAHQYLLDHYKEFDFIWSSPPCPSHSRMRLSLVKSKPVYPDMTLYQEIIFLQSFFKGVWVVENVVPYYKPLIPATVELDRHLFWTNKPTRFIFNERSYKGRITDQNKETLAAQYGIELPAGTKNQRKLLRNAVDPSLGLHVFNAVNQLKSQEQVNDLVALDLGEI